MVKALASYLFPNEECNGERTKSGNWRFGYTNDYPLQHGNGENVTMPVSVIRKMYAILPESIKVQFPLNSNLK